jgi:hypothetical protein
VLFCFFFCEPLPSYLDSEQRIHAARVIKRFILHAKKTAFVVEHDFIMSSYLADRVVVYVAVWLCGSVAVWLCGCVAVARPPVFKSGQTEQYWPSIDRVSRHPPAFFLYFYF